MFWIWAGFLTLVVSLLLVDLLAFNRKAHEIKMREALITSAVWIAVGLSFSIVVYFAYDYHWMGLGLANQEMDNPRLPHNGKEAFVMYLTGYVVEKALSVDNLFVIATIFAGLGIPAKFQHRVLFWGILGALVMRGVMIGLGVALVAQFEWILYVFGVLLIFTGIKLLFSSDHDAPLDPANSKTVKLVSRVLPVTHEFNGQKFFTRRNAALVGTPLLLALVMVETADVVFAVDSIPAIIAITQDPFLVFSSNAFAIVGLRSLYFALAGLVKAFKYLSLSLAAVLVLIGVKMLLHHWLDDWLGEWRTLTMLAMVLLILGTGVVASIFAKRKESIGLVEGAERATGHRVPLASDIDDPNLHDPHVREERIPDADLPDEDAKPS